VSEKRKGLLNNRPIMVLWGGQYNWVFTRVQKFLRVYLQWILKAAFEFQLQVQIIKINSIKKGERLRRELYL
jgi:hypothetical protein